MAAGGGSGDDPDGCKPTIIWVILIITRVSRTGKVPGPDDSGGDGGDDDEDSPDYDPLGASCSAAAQGLLLASLIAPAAEAAGAVVVVVEAIAMSRGTAFF